MSAIEVRAEPGTFVHSLERGLAVLRAFDADHARMRLSDVARRTGVSRAAARRFLLTLAALGYVREDGGEFSLQPKVLELGYAYLSGLGRSGRAQPHLDRLAAELAEPVALAVLDGDDIGFVARAQGSRVLAPVHVVGERWPALPTSAGRILLGALPAPELAARLARVEVVAHTPRTERRVPRLRRAVAEAAARGWSVVDQELEEGLVSVAVPVREGGVVVAALTAALPAGRWPVDRVRDDVVPLLRETATAIEG